MEKIEALPELSGCTYDIGNIRRGNKNKTVEEILFDNKEGDLLYNIIASDIPKSLGRFW